MARAISIGVLMILLCLVAYRLVYIDLHLSLSPSSYRESYVSDEVWYVTSARNILVKLFGVNALNTWLGEGLRCTLILSGRPNETLVNELCSTGSCRILDSGYTGVEYTYATVIWGEGSTATIPVPLGSGLNAVYVELYDDLEPVAKKAWFTTMLTLILVLYAATTWLTPLTGLAGGEYDRVLMSVTPLMIACGVSVFSHAGRIPGLLLALLVVTPGLYATLNPSLQYLNQPYIYALNRMPPYLGPVPGSKALLNDLLDVSMHAAEIYRDGGVLVTSDPCMRFIHLHLRNPDTSRLINTWWSLDPDVLASLIASHDIKEFTVLMEKQPDPEGFKDAVSTLLREKYSVTEAVLRVETMYCGTSYCLYKFTRAS